MAMTPTLEDSKGLPYLTAPETITALVPGALYHSGHGNMNDWADIAAQAPITAIVDLARNSDQPTNMPMGPEALYLHWPLHDDYEGPLRTPHWPTLRGVADFVGDLVKAGHVVLVRCRGGRNRSSVVLGATLVRNFEYSPQEAVRLIMDARLGTWTNEGLKRWFLSMNRSLKEQDRYAIPGW